MDYVSTEAGPTLVRPPLVRWGAVFSGTIIGLALTVLAGSLWVALAFGSHQATFYNHLAWWLAGTAIVATFLAAMIAAAVSGVRGMAAGLMNGLTTWGLLVLGTLIAGVPGLLAYGATRPIMVSGIRVAVTTVQPWTTFWALLIGLGAAAIGGMLGGVSRRRSIERPEIDVRDSGAAPRAVETREAEPVGSRRH